MTQQAAGTRPGEAAKEGFHSEVIGSLLRPDYVHDAMKAFDAGDISADQLSATQDRAVVEAVELQQECGLDVITDGEMRRTLWSDPLTESLAGYGHDERAAVPFKGKDETVLRPPVVTGRLGPKANLPLREYEFLRSQTRHAVKATLPSLTYASVLWEPGVSDEAYPDRDEYLEDALELTRRLVRELADAGVRYVQLDAPRYTHLVSDEGKANMQRLGLNPDTWLGDMIELDNRLMADFPEVTFGLHLCRGNHRSMWSVEGGYDPIAEQLFTTIDCDRLLLEYDTPRAGTFAPLRFVPESKSVVLGLITTKEAELEGRELLHERVEEASQYVPVERLGLSPQCGFASVHTGNLISFEEQRAKLMRLGEVAREIWA